MVYKLGRPLYLPIEKSPFVTDSVRAQILLPLFWELNWLHSCPAHWWELRWRDRQEDSTEWSLLLALGAAFPSYRSSLPWSPPELHCSHAYACPPTPLLRILTLAHTMDFPSWLQTCLSLRTWLELTGMRLTLLTVSRPGLHPDLLTWLPGVIPDLTHCCALVHRGCRVGLAFWTLGWTWSLAFP